MGKLKYKSNKFFNFASDIRKDLMGDEVGKHLDTYYKKKKNSIMVVPAKIVRIKVNRRSINY